MPTVKKKTLVKFLLLCALMAGYFGYLTYEYDLLTGGVAALLTWSFFVLCTPIADAGFLLDFPLRLLFGIRMVISEIVVWAIAITINAYSLHYATSYYNTTILTKLLHQILITPYPYWLIILLSGAGTFLSVYLGDGVMDIISHSDQKSLYPRHIKYKILMILSFIIIIFIYYNLVASLNIDDILAYQYTRTNFA